MRPIKDVLTPTALQGPASASTGAAAAATPAVSAASAHAAAATQPTAAAAPATAAFRASQLHERAAACHLQLHDQHDDIRSGERGGGSPVGRQRRGVRRNIHHQPAVVAADGRHRFEGLPRCSDFGERHVAHQLGGAERAVQRHDRRRRSASRRGRRVCNRRRGISGDVVSVARGAVAATAAHGTSRADEQL